jgi:DNA-directed RNA polymerase specialized sigma24 family protein
LSGVALHLPAPVARAIRFEAFLSSRRLRRYGYGSQDVHQELLLHWWRRRSHDGDRSSEATFASRACRHRAIQITEGAVAAKRGGGAVPDSFSQPVSSADDGARELGDTISHDAYAMSVGRQSRPAAELEDLRLDVARVLAGLPPHLANLAHQLMYDTISAAAQATTIGRSTAHRHMVAIKKAFVDARVDLYVRRGHRNTRQGGRNGSR